MIDWNKEDGWGFSRAVRWFFILFLLALIPLQVIISHVTKDKEKSSDFTYCMRQEVYTELKDCEQFLDDGYLVRTKRECREQIEEYGTYTHCHRVATTDPVEEKIGRITGFDVPDYKVTEYCTLDRKLMQLEEARK